jgi:hypothetical protein
MKNKIVLLFIGALWILSTQVSYAAFPVKSNPVAEQKTTNENVIKDAEFLKENQVVAPALPQNNYVDTKKGNGFGIAALSCSLVGLVYPLFGVLGIVFGAIGMSKNRKLRGLAIAGFALGILDLISILLVAAFFILIFL